MKRLAFAISLLLLGVGAAVPARADFGVIKFPSDYCRVWDNTATGPQDGHYLWFRYRSHHRYHSHYRFLTAAGADRAMHRAVASHRCNHWWW